MDDMVKTGIPLIDDRAAARRGGFGIVTGVPGVGTTLLLQQFCQQATVDSVPLFICSDVQPHVLRHRFGRQQFGLRHSMVGSRIMLETLENSPRTLRNIENTIQGWRAWAPGGTGVVCVDRLDQFNLYLPRAGERDPVGRAMADNAAGLAVLALKYDVMIWTTVPAGRDAAGTQHLRMHHIAGNSHIGDAASVVLGLAPAFDVWGRQVPGEFNLEMIKSRYTVPGCARMMRDDYLVLKPAPVRMKARALQELGI